MRGRVGRVGGYCLGQDETGGVVPMSGPVRMSKSRPGSSAGRQVIPESGAMAMLPPEGGLYRGGHARDEGAAAAAPETSGVGEPEEVLVLDEAESLERVVKSKTFVTGTDLLESDSDYEVEEEDVVVVEDAAGAGQGSDVRGVRVDPLLAVPLRTLKEERQRLLDAQAQAMAEMRMAKAKEEEKGKDADEMEEKLRAAEHALKRREEEARRQLEEEREEARTREQAEETLPVLSDEEDEEAARERMAKREERMAQELAAQDARRKELQEFIERLRLPDEVTGLPNVEFPEDFEEQVDEDVAFVRDAMAMDEEVIGLFGARRTTLQSYGREIYNERGERDVEMEKAVAAIRRNDLVLRARGRKQRQVEDEVFPEKAAARLDRQRKLDERESDLSRAREEVSRLMKELKQPKGGPVSGVRIRTLSEKDEEVLERVMGPEGDSLFREVDGTFLAPEAGTGYDVRTGDVDAMRFIDDRLSEIQVARSIAGSEVGSVAGSIANMADFQSSVAPPSRGGRSAPSRRSYSVAPTVVDSTIDGSLEGRSVSSDVKQDFLKAKRAEKELAEREREVDSSLRALRMSEGARATGTNSVDDAATQMLDPHVLQNVIRESRLELDALKALQNSDVTGNGEEESAAGEHSNRPSSDGRPSSGQRVKSVKPPRTKSAMSREGKPLSQLSPVPNAEVKVTSRRSSSATSHRSNSGRQTKTREAVI